MKSALVQQNNADCKRKACGLKQACWIDVIVAQQRETADAISAQLDAGEQELYALCFSQLCK